MLTDLGSVEVQGLLDRLRGPDASLVADLAIRASLHRPVMIDATPVIAAVRPYTWLLTRAGEEGIRLTSAGYLPPAVVTEAVRSLGWDKEWPGCHNREHLTPPVLELRYSARRLGLVRTHRGLLLRTLLGERLQQDPGQLWWHVASRLPEGREHAERDAGLLLLLAVAAATPLNSDATDHLLQRGMRALGWHDARSGRPIADWQAFRAAHGTWACLHRLGAIAESRYGEDPVPPPPAGVALARAALRGPVA